MAVATVLGILFAAAYVTSCLLVGLLKPPDDALKCKLDGIPPVISCPTIPKVLIAPKLYQGLQVCFGEVTAEDNCCKPMIKSYGGYRPCEHYTNGTYSIYYFAIDENGNTADCSVTFTVKVVTCPFEPYPTNAQAIHYSSLYQQPIYGNIMQIICQPGYKLVGPSEQECTANGTWSHGGSSATTCQITSCPNLLGTILPAMFEIVTYTLENNYGSYAFLRCKNDSLLTNGSSYIVCQSDGTWSNTTAKCTDKTPPLIHGCPNSINLYSNRSSYGTYYDWVSPTVTDNLDALVELKQVMGPKPGSFFSEYQSPYTISYTATDSSGNIAIPCTFIIYVSPLMCNDDDIPLSTRFQYRKCETDNGIIRWGSTCTLGCYPPYPLVGPKSVTCEVTYQIMSRPQTYWNWGGEKPSYCEVKKCTIPPAPLNGAIACSKWSNGEICQIQCNEKYDIPETINPAIGVGVGMYVCNNVDGTWSPKDAVIPNCTERFDSESAYRSLSVLSYYYGECNSPVGLSNIRKNFLQALNSSGYNSACGPSVECKTENVDVICNELSRRKRSLTDKFNVYTEKKSSTSSRTMATIKFSFRFVVTVPSLAATSNNIKLWNEINTNVNAAFSNMIKLFRQDLAHGKYDKLGIDGLKIDNSSLVISQKRFNCPLGMKFRLSTFSCVSCPTGTFYNDTLNDCKSCPVASYQDEVGQLSCKRCPQFYSTIKDGQAANSSCIPQCFPGSYSNRGVQPCDLCPPGSYQSKWGQTSCTKCPSGQLSLITGEKDASKCAAYELQFLSPESQIRLTTNYDKISRFSIHLWVLAKMSKTGQIFEVKQFSNTLFQLSNPGSLTISYFRITVDTGYSISDETWHYLRIIVDVVSCSLALYDGENSVYAVSNDNIICGTALTSITTVKLGSDNNSFKGSITQFSITSSTAFLTSSIAQKCYVDDSNAVLKWVHLISVTQSKNVIASISTCGCNTCSTKPDYCKHVACSNNGTCVSNSTDFTCYCKRGYSGRYCEKVIVNGQWCPWDEWSLCNATCGGGFKERFRNCSCPTPSSDGQSCAGDDHDISPCNIQNCTINICPDVPAMPAFVRANCSGNASDSASCQFICDYGYKFNSTHMLYTSTCSKYTNYSWSMDVNSLPPCAKIDLPQKETVVITINYSAVPCEELSPLKEHVETVLREKISNSHCFQNGTCQMAVTVSQCRSNGVSKLIKNNNTTANITFEVTPSFHIHAGSTSQNAVVLEELLEVIQQINDTQMALENLVTASADGQLDFKTFKSSSVIAQTHKIDCPSGMINDEGICVQCLKGTYQNEHSCIFCPLDTYQPLDGQTTCLNCPANFTTKAIGATNCTVEKKPPRITTYPLSEIAYEPFEKVELLCEAEGVPKPKFIWKHNDIAISLNVTNMKDKTAHGTLVFENATMSHEGTYQCIAENSLGRIASNKTILKAAVTKPPKIIESPPLEIIYKPFDEVKLSCIAEGEPVPTYTWKRNGADIPLNMMVMSIESDQKGTLVIQHSSISDEGIYQCIAMNAFGKAVSPETRLKAAVIRSFPNIDGDKTPEIRHTPKVGMPLVLECKRPFSYPAQVFWTLTVKNNVLKQELNFRLVELNERVTTDNNGSLYFANVLESDGFSDKMYTCVLNNPYLRSYVQGLDQSIHPVSAIGNNVVRQPGLAWHSPSPIIALAGTRTQMKCIFSGFPTPKVSWEHLNGTLSIHRHKVNGMELSIMNVSHKDAGVYRCKASNGGSETVEVNISLIVESTPKFVTEPVDLVILYGEDAEFTCKAIGKPTPVLSWTSNNIPLNSLLPDPRRILSADGTRLLIRNVTQEDVQVFQCNASNHNGYVLKNAILNVLTKAAKIIKKPSANETATEGQDVTITCQYFGIPRPTLTWSIEEETTNSFTNINNSRFIFQSNGDLLIKNVHLSDSATYHCHVRNRFGEDEASSQLIVKDKISV